VILTSTLKNCISEKLGRPSVSRGPLLPRLALLCLSVTTLATPRLLPSTIHNAAVTVSASKASSRSQVSVVPTLNLDGGLIYTSGAGTSSEDSWVATTCGTLFLTWNGGDSWHRVLPPLISSPACRGLSIRAVSMVGDHFVSVDVAGVPNTVPSNSSCVAGNAPHRGGAIELSDDGGSSWRIVALPDCASDSGVQSLRFLNPEIGYASGDGHLFRTLDEGSSWQRVATKFLVGAAQFTDPVDGEASSVSSGHGEASGDVFLTDDGGLSWSSVPNPINPASARSSGSFTFVGSRSLVWLRAQPGSQVSVRWTSDAGLQWTDSTAPLTSGSGLFSAVASEEWFEAAGQVYASTDDAGRVWNAVKLSMPRGYSTFYSLYCSTSKTCWALVHEPGKGLALLRGINGRDWTVLSRSD
jgi:photosystem II stability/assembly factor-like uncharacterized protein